MEILKSIISDIPHWFEILICLGITVLMSSIFGVTYCYFKRKQGFYKDIPMTLVLFPIIICGIALIINAVMLNLGNVTEVETRYGRIIIALIAAAVMIRFRSQQRSTEDLTYILFMTCIGICNGLGYIYFGLILYIVFLVCFVVLSLINFPIQSKKNLNLKITIPEDLNYEKLFDDIFEKYTNYSELTKVNTSDMGTMFVLNYEIILKNGVSSKEMIDDIRCKNGNLNVVMTIKKFKSGE